MTMRLTHEEFLQKVQQIHGDKFTLLEEYKNSYTPIQIRCNDCGYTAKMNPRTLIEGHSCPNCAKLNGQNKNEQKFKKTLYDKFNGTIDMIDSYINATTPIKFHCNNCGNEWITEPKTIVLTKGCQHCYTNRHSMTNEEFQQRLKKKFNGNITTNDTYNNMITKMTFKCNRCGNTWETTWNSLKHYRALGCRICNAQLQRKTTEQFKQDLKKVHGQKLSVLSEYITAIKPIQIRCNICNRIFEATPNTLLSGKGCNCLSISKGEQYCEEFLIEHGCNYKTQYKLNDCKDKNPLPFDFAIFDNQEQLLCLIEFDGKQHLSADNCHSDDKDQRQKFFEYTQKHDQIKTNYCLNNKIPLIRVQYQASFGKMGIQAKKLIYQQLTQDLINQFPQCINIKENLNRNFDAIKKQNKYKSTEQFKQEIKELHGDKITITDKYKNAYTKIACHCNICGNDWKTTPRSLLHNLTGCPQCAKYKNSKTHEEFIQELILINSNFEVLETYKNARTPLLTRCKLCGKEAKYTPIDLLRRRKCDCMK